MTAQLMLLSVDLASIVALLLFALRLVTGHPRQRESWLIVLMCITAIAHVALSRAEYGPWMPEAYRFSFGSVAPFMNVMRNLTPGLFALLTGMFFTDRRRQPLWLYGLLVAQWMLESLRVGAVLGVTPGVIAGANTLSAWLQIAFAATAIYWTIGYWRADLIAARRRTRAVVAIILCVNVVASTILLRLVIPENSIGNYYGHVVLSMATLALLLFLLLRSMNGDVGIFTYDQPAAAPTMPLQVLEERRQAKARPGTDAIRKSEDELALKRLDGLLRDQHIHWESGLSLKQLAERVRLPEYRLRQLIHEHLGHRNFNSFLHVYRIHDAVEQLTDPGRRGTPILAIAQSVGYESVNTFNRGFKEVMNVTPSEYRERALP